MSFHVEKALAEDLPKLREMYLAMLEERQPQGHNFYATDETADWMMAHVFEPAVHDLSDGLFVATSGDELIAALYWCLAPHPFPTRHQWATGWGMYVVPSWRRQGVIKALLERGKQWAIDRRVSRVLDEAITPEARSAAMQAGFVVSTDVVILEV